MFSRTVRRRDFDAKGVFCGVRLGGANYTFFGCLAPGIYSSLGEHIKLKWRLLAPMHGRYTVHTRGAERRA